MGCTTFMAMCENCQFQYKALANHGEDAESLEYNPETYPLVFKSNFEFPAGTFELAQDHAKSLLHTVKYRLHSRFGKPVSAFCDYEMLQETDEHCRILVQASLLVDFPCQVLAGREFRSTLRGVTAFSQGFDAWNFRIEVDDELMKFLFEGLGLGVVDWDAYITSTQDDLCRARLCWFLKRANMVTYF
ncbi:hypothetical protein BJX76DRAFT_352696 [Aspergillus varians]